MKQSVYIIKPDGIHYESIIHTKITESKLEIISQKEVRFSKQSLREIFSPELENYIALCEYLVSGPCIAGIVSGEEAIEKLLTITGRKTEPEDCAIGSIRREFGIGWSKLSSGLYVIKNVIHRSKSMERAMEEIKWYEKI